MAVFPLLLVISTFIPQLIHKAELCYAVVIFHTHTPHLSPACFVLRYVLKALLKEMVSRSQEASLSSLQMLI